MLKTTYDNENHTLTVKNNDYKYEFESTSEPLLSSNREYMAFISPYEWECKGTVHLMKVVSGEIEKISFNLKDDLTPKFLLWNNNDTLLLLIGPLWGTVSVGGDLYSYNLNDKKLNLLKKFDKKIQIKEIHALNENSLSLNGIKYIDDIFNEYDDINIIYKI